MVCGLIRGVFYINMFFYLICFVEWFLKVDVGLFGYIVVEVGDWIEIGCIVG